MKQTDFARILTKYLSAYLPGQRNVSPNTIRSYRDTFKQLLIFIQETTQLSPEKVSFHEVESETIRSYLHWLEAKRKVSINTRNQRLAAIHSFYRYATIEIPDVLFESQRILGIPFKKRKRVPIDYLQKDCLQSVFEQPDVSTSKGRRDLTLMTVLYDTGARVQELIDVKVCDVRLQEPPVITLTGKGNKSRCIPLMKKTKNLLTSYMQEHHLLDNGNQQFPLFYNHHFEKFTRPGITYILKKYFQMAKEKEPTILFPSTIHPHMFRHTKAVHLLEAGVNLLYIRDLLGHVSVTTTEVYLKTDTESKRKALENAYPSDVIQNIPVWTENTELIEWLKNFCR